MNQWTKFDRVTDTLCAGDLVRFSPRSKLFGRIGVFQKRLVKNYSFRIDGQDWRINPCFIVEFQTGSADNLPPKSTVEVKTSNVHNECEVGDVVLMYRGTFDVVEITNLFPLRCKSLNGRTKGNIYRYKETMFVQKLDDSRIVV